MSESKRFSEFDPSLAYSFISYWEGKKLIAYKCQAGVWTIGVGHTAGVKEGDAITEEEAQSLFESDCAQFQQEASKLIRVKVTENQFIALMSFIFNFGTEKFKRSSVLRNLNAGAITQAAESFLLWNKAGGKVSNGLVRRRKAERALFLNS
jgi:lysozyme